jgi:hypothetical protein
MPNVTAGSASRTARCSPVDTPDLLRGKRDPINSHVKIKIKDFFHNGNVSRISPRSVATQEEAADGQLGILADFLASRRRAASTSSACCAVAERTGTEDATPYTS